MKVAKREKKLKILVMRPTPIYLYEILLFFPKWLVTDVL